MHQISEMGQIALQFAIAHQTELWSLATVLLPVLIGHLLRRKPKLFYSVHHSANLLVDEPLLDGDGKKVADRQLVRTASIVVENAGPLPAKAVEVAFNWKPPILNVTPARAFDAVDSSFDRYSLKFDSLAPKELVTIEIMSINHELPLMTAVRCEDCVAKLIQMSPQRVWPTWYVNSLGLLVLLGAATFVYLVITLIQVIAG